MQEKRRNYTEGERKISEARSMMLVEGKKGKKGKLEQLLHLFVLYLFFVSCGHYPVPPANAESQ